MKRISKRIMLMTFLSLAMSGIPARARDSQGSSQDLSQLASRALTLAHPFKTTLDAAIAYALAGQDSKAETLARGISRDRPDNMFVQVFGYATAQAIIALNHGNAKRAIEILGPATAYDSTTPLLLYLRGAAYLQSGKGQEATHEFQRIVNLHSFRPDDPIISLALLGQARSYKLVGDTTKARIAYQDFLALWKDADPDIPILKQAKEEYAKLQ
jgi:eukaryotic-like serine/threonine-protein kinase